MAIKLKLKVQIAAKEMTQRQLAEAAHVRPPTISAMCTGSAKHIPLSALDRICDVLGCQPGDIIERVPDQTPEDAALWADFDRLAAESASENDLLNDDTFSRNFSGREPVSFIDEGQMR